MHSTRSKSRALSHLTTFKYQGYDSRGKKLSGEARGKTASAVKAQLKSDGIIVKKISKKQNYISKNNKIKTKEITIFTRQLATMLSSGIPLLQSLDVCMKSSENPTLADMLNQIKSSVEHGHSFSESLALYPQYFNSLYRSLLAVGEDSGTLDVMLIRVAEHHEKLELLKAKFKKTLLYPSAIIIVSIFVTAILLIYVVPQFESMFNSFNAELPWFTQVVLNISKWLQLYWYYLIVSLFTLGYVTYKQIKKSKAARIVLDKILLNIPIIGNIVNKICLARFARTLNTMLSSGIPLLNSLQAVSNVVNNEVYTKAIKELQEEIEGGYSFHVAMQNSHCFNHLIVQMVSIGENSGTLDKMLLKIAELYEENIDNTVDNLSSIIEPIIILILSIIVGSLIVAMYLPIFTLGTVI